jgi:hypothetical protein
MVARVVEIHLEYGLSLRMRFFQACSHETIFVWLDRLPAETVSRTSQSNSVFFIAAD